MNKFKIAILSLLFCFSCTQDLSIKESSFCKSLVPGKYILEAGEGQWNWCMAPIYDEEGKLHVFMSSIPYSGSWTRDSEILHFVADSPVGPYTFVDTTFSSDTATYHNPQISKVGDTYVLVYLGKSNLTPRSQQSIGIATAKSLYGPWKESPNNPIIKPSNIPGSPNATHASNPTFLVDADGNYRIYYTLQECQAMIEETKQAIEEAGEEESLAQDEADEDSGECMSTQAWCSDECMETQALQSVKTKVEQLVGMPWKYAEELHFIQYIPGQRYGSHHDYIDQEAESLHGPRLWTILFYLNDLDGNGGETCFPALNDLCIKPKLGRALLWPQVLNDNPEARDNSTWHEAKEISEGFKFASTVWYHLRDYERSNELGCIDTFQDDDEEEDEDDDYDDDDTGEDSEIENE